LRLLVPISAIGALEAHEERQVKDHLERCPECVEVLRGGLEAAAALAFTCPPVAPGAAFRRSLLAAVDEIPREVPFVPQRRRRLGLNRQARSTHLLESQERFIAELAFPIRAVVPMVATGAGGRAKKSSGRIYVSADERSGGLVATGLADPGPGIYQLWLLGGTEPSALQAFRPDAQGLALVPIEADLLRNGAFAVTLEPQAGNASPQGSMVLRSG
jgi:hypothetical protein